MANEKIIWDILFKEFKNSYGVAGLMGNLFAESSLNPQNLQNTYEKKLNMTDASYTKAVDNGSYKKFSTDNAGYGLAQWAYKNRKENLLNFAKQQSKSIGDLETQVKFLIKELKAYNSVYDILCSAKSVKEASDIVLMKYECPQNVTDDVKKKRAEYGEKFYNLYNNTTQKEEQSMTIDFDKYIYSTGTHYISNSGSDEKGNYTGGTAGDQTGKEWQLKSWYSRPWTHVFRYTGPDKRVQRTLAELGIKAPLNNKIGYDQYQRTTYWTQLSKVGYDPSKIEIACEEDCSAGVASNIKACGYLLNIEALKNVTVNMTSRSTLNILKTAGFQVLTDNKYLTSGKYLQPGDILLYANHHVAMNITKGKYATDVGPGYWSHTSSSIAPSEPIKTIGYAIALQDMNIRSNNNIASQSYGIIEKGTKVAIIEKMSNNWLKIVYDKAPDNIGYTSNTKPYYDIIIDAAPAPIVKPEPVWKGDPASVKNPTFGATEVPQAKDDKLAGNMVITASKAINVRRGPGTNFDIIIAVPKTTILKNNGYYTLNADGTKWYYIVCPYKSVTIEGFVSEKYVKKV